MNPFTNPFPTLCINSRGKLYTFHEPVVMGILNATTDSFYGASRHTSVEEAVSKAREMAEQGASVIDVGGSSSRPGSVPAPLDLELKRVIPVIKAIRSEMPELLISVDTFRARVAEKAFEAGADIVNDISAGEDDADMLPTVGNLNMPYIAMHKKGSTADMQLEPEYQNVTVEVCQYFEQKLAILDKFGVRDVILDPGFGFGKTLSHNYQLLRELPVLKSLFNCPLLVGVSRKSMVTRLLGVTPEEALTGTTALHTLALLNGASILRVHDVKEAREVIVVINQYRDTNINF